MKFLRGLVWTMVWILIASTLSGIGLFFYLAPKIPKLPEELKQLASSPPTEVYSRDGELLKRIGGRKYVPIERITPHYLDAVVAVEDQRFYKHRGIDHIALMRSFLQYFKSPEDSPGASTITQQLAKNLFFTFKRSWERKLLEALAAVSIEYRFSKEQIIETYVNLVYYGRYSYGIELATQTYFGKHADQIELHEAALLAGIPNSPSYLNPFVNYERSKKRQLHVLNRMKAAGMISSAQVDSLFNVPLILNQHKTDVERGGFAVDYALEVATSKLGRSTVNYGGVGIHTTIDPVLQNIAEQVMFTGISELEKRLKAPEGGSSRLEGALVAIEVNTGNVVALVGGRDYHSSQYNRAIKSLRQPGSSFKPVVFLAALDRNLVNASTVMVDKKVDIKIERNRSWSPSNFSNDYTGEVTMKLAMMKSINTIAAQLIEKVTPQQVVKTAKLLGIKSELLPYYSLALGGQGVAPIEMASMFSTLASGGISRETGIVRSIEGGGQGVLWENIVTSETRFPIETVYQLNDMLMGVIDGGTGAVIRRKGFRGEAIGKTGTSNDFRDAWFCGATPNLAVVVWIGYDDNKPMRFSNGVGVTGGAVAAPIWADFMLRATATTPTRNFTKPSSINKVWIHPTKGLVSMEYVEGFLPASLTDKVIANLENSQRNVELTPVEEDVLKQNINP